MPVQYGLSLVHRGEDLKRLARGYIKYSLRECDRDALERAAWQINTHLNLGAVAGTILGIVLAFRLQTSRTRVLKAFRAYEQPSNAHFSEGRLGTYRRPVTGYLGTCTDQISFLLVAVSDTLVPDTLKNSKIDTFGHVAAYPLLGFIGYSAGLVTGDFTGRRSAIKVFNRTPGCTERIDKVLRGYQANIMSSGAYALRKRKGVSELLGFATGIWLVDNESWIDERPPESLSNGE
ncbi:MAG: hypothetical protein Q9222_006881 [Ikaeria aurantiellina]